MGVRGVSPSAQSVSRRAHGQRPYALGPDHGGCLRAVCEQARARPEAVLWGALSPCAMQKVCRVASINAIIAADNGRHL